MSRLVVVSNRVAAGGAASSGGLAVAVGSSLADEPALWFGWSGQRTRDYTGRIERHRQGALEIATVDLAEADYEGYYNGYANAALWPLFHARTDLATYDRCFAQAYARVNRRFAEALAPLLAPDDIVWVHDYHLIPLGRELRRLGVTAPIGFFLHVPWPARQLLATLPDHADLVAALFSYDLVGMQTDEDVEAFESYVRREAGGVREGRLFTASGRATVVRHFPIGLDTEHFLALSRSETAERVCDRMGAHNVFRSLIVGVDRLDYSKGIPERLLGFERFLEAHPDMVRKVLYLQVAPSSRGEVEAYQTLRAQVLALAGRINATWAEMDHAPMLCVNRNYGRAELAGIYRAAAVGLVTPLRDGMNLVAKEYVAAQDPADPGVLVLSRFAGASRQMKEALIVNPYSADEMADALAHAIAMPAPERKRRWEALFEGVLRDDVVAWRDSFVTALRSAREERAPEAERPRRTIAFSQLGAEPAVSRSTLAGRGSAISGQGWRPIGQG